MPFFGTQRALEGALLVPPPRFSSPPGEGGICDNVFLVPIGVRVRRAADSRAMSSSRLILLVLSATLVLDASSASSECPSNRLLCSNYYPPVTETLQTTDPTASLWCTSYDLSLGRVAAAAQSNHFEIPATSSVCADDTYWITGGTPGAVLTIRVEWLFKGNARTDPSCLLGYEAANSARVQATLTLIETDQSTSFDVRAPVGLCDERCCFGASSSVNQAVSLSIQVQEGVPFRLGLCANARASGGYSTFQGVLSFADLPPGAMVQSCQGFMQDEPVQSTQTTWGRVKALHR